MPFSLLITFRSRRHLFLKVANSFFFFLPASFEWDIRVSTSSRGEREWNQGIADNLLSESFEWDSMIKKKLSFFACRIYNFRRSFTYHAKLRNALIFLRKMSKKAKKRAFYRRQKRRGYSIHFRFAYEHILGSPFVSFLPSFLFWPLIILPFIPRFTRLVTRPDF